MAQFVEAIPYLLLRIFAPALGVILATWLILLFIPFVRKQVRPVFSVSEGRGRRVPPVQWVVLFSVMVACTLFSGKNTNGVQGVGGPLLQFNPPLALSVTSEDITNGWRVTAETEAESFAQPSANAITNEHWRRRGAFDDALRIPANGWSYPYATGVTVLVRGELRTSIRSRDFPRAFAQGLSLLPLVNWPQLPEGRCESVFWYDTTPSNTLLTTWWNVALGRDATNPVNFQAELFPDGGFTYRYENRTVRHVRVWPFDWDNDGLENSVDPDPLVAGPDAHGTNAEWYNTVCSNVLEVVVGGGTGTTGVSPVGDDVDFSWREGVNSNAYYFVDVVAERGPAPIRFTGDRTSRLGNPVVVARAGETNRVSLLIGVDYAVTSDTPFSVSFPVDYMYPEVETNEPCVARIRWPLVFTVSGMSAAYTVETIPQDLDGTFEWDGVGSSGGQMRGASSCLSAAIRGSVSFGCTGGCGCGGCSISGRYSYERATFALPILWCGCSGNEDPEGEPTPTPHSGPDGNPSVSVSFDREAVIFEDRYENTPGSWVERKSSSATLTITAYGGANGASLSVSGSNLGRLEQVGGSALPTHPVSVPAGCDVTYAVVYHGYEASQDANDVRVDASVTDGMTGASRTDSAAITSIRVELVVEKAAPDAPTCVNRHVYGVLEKVLRRTYPSGLSMTWPVSLDLDYNYDTDDHFYCSLEEKNLTMTATHGDARLPIQIVVERPSVICTGAEWRGEKGSIGDAGCVAMCLFYYVSPRTVSFEGLHMEEVPVTSAPSAGAVTGYFSSVQTPLHATHDAAMGAGAWWPVTTNAYWRMDTARAPLFPHPWSLGTLRGMSRWLGAIRMRGTIRALDKKCIRNRLPCKSTR